MKNFLESSQETMNKSDFTKLPPECDSLCNYRDCLHRGYDKGSYSPGKGYSNYRKKPMYCCLTRLSQGCPGTHSPIDREFIMPAPNWEKVLDGIQAKIDDRETRRTARSRQELMECRDIIVYLLKMKDRK